MYIHAADWAPNLATYTAFYAPMLGQPHVPQPATPNKHTVTFLMTDGDNVQWLLNSFSSPKFV